MHASDEVGCIVLLRRSASAGEGAQASLQITDQQKQRLLAARKRLMAQMGELIQERRSILQKLGVRTCPHAILEFSLSHSVASWQEQKGGVWALFAAGNARTRGF
jgi:hypothetical protein